MSVVIVDLVVLLNPIQDGGEGVGQKGPPTSFSPVTSTNVGISPKTKPQYLKTRKKLKELEIMH